jgi:hypothetical protein
MRRTSRGIIIVIVMAAAQAVVVIVSTSLQDNNSYYRWGQRFQTNSALLFFHGRCFSIVLASGGQMWLFQFTTRGRGRGSYR